MHQCGTELTLVSLFDGIGGFPQALLPVARTVATVEIDEAAAGVTADHFPEAKAFNDVTEVTGAELLAAGFCPRCGVLSGGWPCQDLSLAGRRLGLDGSRSGLFFEIVRLAADLRPRWLLLENVPGLLSAVCSCPGLGVCGSGCADPHPVRGGICGYDGRRGRCMESHGGAMGAVLGALAELGYGFAYRVLDAQHFGVPQRRRRVVLVGCLGDRAAPSEVLLEPDGGAGDSAPGSAARSRAARNAEVLARGAGTAVNSLTTGSLAKYDDNSAQGGHLVAGTAPTLQGGGRRGFSIDPETAAGGGLVALPLTAREGKGVDSGLTSGNLVAAVTAKWATGSGGPAGDEVQNLVGFGGAQITSGENRSSPQPGDPQPPLAATGSPHVAYAVRADPAGVGQGHNTNFVPVQPEVWQQQGSKVQPMGTMRRGNGNVTGGVPFLAHTLSAEGFDASEDGTGRGTPLVPMAFGHANGIDIQASEDITPTLRSANGVGGGSVMQWQGGSNQDQVLNENATAPTLAGASNAHGGHHQPKVMTDGADAAAAPGSAAVRRLTPVECERLQGYPDGWTSTSLGREQSDSARYRQLGNSIALPVFAWVGARIAAVHRERGW